MKVAIVTFAFVSAVLYSSTSAEEEWTQAKLLRAVDQHKRAYGGLDDLIRSEGYEMETYEVETEDGYLLSLHRIPRGKTQKSNGKVAFLQHGLLSSSADWIITGPGNALAYVLADAGYDVWMGNARGNTHSKKHRVFNSKSSDFWKFSWHQIGNIDLPTMIDFVLNKTGVDGVYYAGHSQGTTSFFVMTSTRPEYNAKIKAQVSLAPIGFMNHMTSPLMHLMAFWRKPVGFLLNVIGMNEFLPSTDFLGNVGASVCKQGSITQLLCSNSLFAICGFSPKEMNHTLLPALMRWTPAGSSSRQFLHYAQEISSGHFRQYDHGLMGNMREYGRPSPPDYDLSKITAPVYLIYSRNDWLAAEKDVDRLSRKLGNCKGSLLISDFSFNHLDYMFGIHAKQLVYNKVISLFARH